MSRSKGRSICAAAAYRSGDEIADQRTGELHDYSRRRGVESATIITPADAPAWAHDRGELWNAAEAAETRKNSTVGREFEVGLPVELNAEQRQALAHVFARELVERHGVAADVAIHSPSERGDQRNHHAHILLTTRRLTAQGLGEKSRELDDRQTGRAEVQRWRERWAELANEHLEAAGSDARIDHRSLLDQGITRTPEGKVGHVVAAMERNGIKTERGEERRRAQAERQIDELLSQRRRPKMDQSEQFLQDEERKKKEARREHFAQQARNRQQEQAKADEQRRRELHAPPGVKTHKPSWRILKERAEALGGKVEKLPNGEYVMAFDDPKTGAQILIQDHGDRLTIEGGDHQAAAAKMLEIAKAKGWDSIAFSGGDDWRETAIREALKQGHKVAAHPDHPGDEELIKRIRQEHLAQVKQAHQADIDRAIDTMTKQTHAIDGGDEKEEDENGPRMR